MEYTYTFTAFGHPNILATHRTTVEITKDNELTKKGDCIIAVAAGFSLQRIKELIGSCNTGDKIRIIIAVGEVKDEITATVNKSFSSSREIVLRKGDFASERTLGTWADKAACDLKRELVERLRSKGTAAEITIDCRTQ